MDVLGGVSSPWVARESTYVFLGRGISVCHTTSPSGRIMRLGIISSYQSAATSDMVKIFWS